MKPAKTVMLSAWADHGVWHGIIQGVRSYTEKHKPWHLRFTSPLALTDAIRDWGLVDGLIGHFLAPQSLPRGLRAGNRVISTVNDGMSKLPVVCQDDYAIGRLAAEEFLQRGFRHFGSYVGAPFVFARERNRGFIERLRKAGFGCAVHVQNRSAISYYRHPQAAFKRALIPWIKSLPKPVGVFTGGDHFAAQFIDACEFAGVAVPDEAAVIGVDNDEVCCTLAHPPLSSVYTPGEIIGFKAAELLHRLFRGVPAPSRPIFIQPIRVVVRRSSNILAVDDSAVAAALRHIHEHDHEAVGVKELETVAGGISLRSLHRRFVKLLGYGPGEAAIRARVERAKTLLASTDISIEEIAHRCGWSNGRTLSTLFQQRTGMRPGQFRAREMAASKGQGTNP